MLVHNLHRRSKTIMTGGWFKTIHQKLREAQQFFLRTGKIILYVVMMHVAVYDFISSLETEYKLQLSVSAVSSLANYEYLNLVHNSISSEYLCLRYCLFLVPGAAPRDRSYGSSIQQTRTCDLQIDSILTSILHQSSQRANLYLHLVESASTTFPLWESIINGRFLLRSWSFIVY